MMGVQPAQAQVGVPVLAVAQTEPAKQPATTPAAAAPADAA
jgi:hypothetical protein